LRLRDRLRDLRATPDVPYLRCVWCVVRFRRAAYGRRWLGGNRGFSASIAGFVVSVWNRMMSSARGRIGSTMNGVTTTISSDSFRWNLVLENNWPRIGMSMSSGTPVLTRSSVFENKPDSTRLVLRLTSTVLYM